MNTTFEVGSGSFFRFFSPTPTKQFWYSITKCKHRNPVAKEKSSKTVFFQNDVKNRNIFVHLECDTY